MVKLKHDMCWMNRGSLVLLIVVVLVVAACAKKNPVAGAQPAPPPEISGPAAAPSAPPAPPQRVEDSVPLPALNEDAGDRRTLAPIIIKLRLEARATGEFMIPATQDVGSVDGSIL